MGTKDIKKEIKLNNKPINTKTKKSRTNKGGK